MRNLAAVVALLFVVLAAPRAALGAAPVTWPATVNVAPYGSVTFIQPDQGRDPRVPPPSAPDTLTVYSQSDRTVAASYDGATLTLAAPADYTVAILNGCDAAAGNPVSCPATPCGQLCYGPSAMPRDDVYFTTFAPGVPVTPPEVQSLSVTYPAGWNLIAGIAGTYGRVTRLDSARGPIYTLRSGDMQYTSIGCPCTIGAENGYWAYFPQESTVSMPAEVDDALLYPLKAQAGQYLLIGNPLPVPATVSGADAVFVYDPGQGYRLTTELAVGQGAVAYSAAGGQITFAPVAAASTP